MRAFILLGDKSSHGGTVISASTASTINGKGIARVGDKVTCPHRGHGGVSTIVTGDSSVMVEGKPAARVGDKTACGAVLFNTQGFTAVG